MKYTWEARDVVSGRTVDTSNRAERYMIGYDPSIIEGGKMTLVSLRDGMLSQKGLTAEEMAQHLNDAGMRATCIRDDDMVSAAE